MSTPEVDKGAEKRWVSKGKIGVTPFPFWWNKLSKKIDVIPFPLLLFL